MGIEPTHRRLRRCTGFEARGGHQAPGASTGGRWAPLRHPESPTTVAPFRAWRGSRGSVAQDPAAIIYWPLALNAKDGGGGGIRTHGAGFSPHTRFPVVPLRPLGHPSLGQSDFNLLFLVEQGLKWRRGRDSNPRRAERPSAAFEAAPFDHSGTPPPSLKKLF